MAVSGASMRLTVDVTPLTEENTHGPYRDAAIAAFKARRFALPVQLDDTFEQVWRQIEERYKRNYLTPMQAQSFTIKVLQDFYECDLDLGDTVRSIFEGESDPAKRMVRVVPSFVYRDFSVPVTSNLRPASAQKRQRGMQGGLANKRRRLESIDETAEVDQDRPLPSTEDEHGGSDNADAAQANGDEERSKSNSIVQFGSAQTGGQEFGFSIKEESPELGAAPVHSAQEPEVESATATASTHPSGADGTAKGHRLDMSARNGAHPFGSPKPQQEPPVHQDEPDVVLEDDHATVQESVMGDVEDLPEDLPGAPPAHAPVPQPESDIQRSPRSSTALSPEPAPQQPTSLRRDIYEASPEFVRPAKRVTRAMRKYNRRSLGNVSKDDSIEQAEAPAIKKPNGIQLAARDEIESTPNAEISAEARDNYVARRGPATPGERRTVTPQSNGTGPTIKSPGLKRPTQKHFVIPTNPALASNGKTASNTPKKQTTGTPARVRNSPAPNRMAASPGISIQEKLRRIRELNERTKRESTARRESLARSSSGPPSPEILAKGKTAPGFAKQPTASQLSLELSTSSQTVDGAVQPKGRNGSLATGEKLLQEDIPLAETEPPVANGNQTPSIPRETANPEAVFKVPIKKHKVPGPTELVTPQNKGRCPSAATPLTYDEMPGKENASGPRPMPRRTPIPLLATTPVPGRRGSEVSLASAGKGSTPIRNSPVPLPANVRHLATKASVLPAPGNAHGRESTPLRNEIPLTANVRRLSSNASAPTPEHAPTSVPCITTAPVPEFARNVNEAMKDKEPSPEPEEKEPSPPAEPIEVSSSVESSHYSDSTAESEGEDEVEPVPDKAAEAAEENKSDATEVDDELLPDAPNAPAANNTTTTNPPAQMETSTDKPATSPWAGVPSWGFNNTDAPTSAQPEQAQQAPTSAQPENRSPSRSISPSTPSAKERSRSPSGTPSPPNSARSSPETAAKPARLLLTDDETDEDEEEEERSEVDSVASEAAAAAIALEESDSSSSESDSDVDMASVDSGDEEDIPLLAQEAGYSVSPALNTPAPKFSHGIEIGRRSVSQLDTPTPAASAPMAASQPARSRPLNHTSVPLPGVRGTNGIAPSQRTSAAATTPSSQRISASQPQPGSLRRTGSQYQSQYPTVSQLKAGIGKSVVQKAVAKPTSFDPKTSNLSFKNSKGKKVVFPGDESDDEESSSSDSDNDGLVLPLRFKDHFCAVM